jgi:prepilin-type N-terminal cleavage/methylation domain-containing protein/prepilin-type processing-associated H-X9-DG protein
MQTKKGFTLIELLVVIAIIAILAAILFPVFANARDKARQISDLSNLKQLALGVVMYTSDYDDTYPIGEVADDSGESVSWIQSTAPYLGSANIFYGPNDTNAGEPAGVAISAYGLPLGWAGKEISIGANALDGADFYGSQSDMSTKNRRFGIFDAYSAYNNFVNGISCKQSEITQPAGTIMLADLQSSDIVKLQTTANVSNSVFAGLGNASLVAGSSLIGSAQAGIWGSGATTAFNIAIDPNTGIMGFGWASYMTAQNSGAWQIPNPYRSASAAYPAGTSGIVSSPFSSKSLTNFAYADGHAKAKKPAATNPDGNIGFNSAYSTGGDNVVGDPNNEWVAGR